MPVGWTLVTPPRPAALAVVQITGDAANTLRTLGLPPQPVGTLRLRDILGIDEGLVAIVSPTLVQLTPHGGPHVVRSLLDALTERGLAESSSPAARELFPEAQTILEAEMLLAMSRAASPAAIDLLAKQPSLWTAAGHHDPDHLPASTTTPRDDRLRRLIDPPLVIAVGPANIGKSTLLNRLARRDVSIVADEPGTTRDHVGATVDCDGLVLHYLDTPGIRDSAEPLERQAIRSSLERLSDANLILLMGDAQNPPVALPQAGSIPTLRIHLRCDLGKGDWQADIHVSAASGEGLTDLSALLRESLLPTADFTGEPWVFWPPTQA